MGITDTVYAATFELPDLIEQDRALVLTCPIYREGVLVAPTEAGSTVTVTRPDGTALVDAQAVTVTGDIATYSLAAATTTDEDLGERWMIEWSLILDRPLVPYVFRNLAALVLRRLYPVVTESTLYGRMSSLDPRGDNPISTSQQWSTKLDEAWIDIQHRLIRRGRRTHLICEPSALRQAHLALTLAMIFEDLASRQGEHTLVAEGFRAEFRDAWNDIAWARSYADESRPESDAKMGAGRSVTWLGSRR